MVTRTHVAWLPAAMMVASALMATLEAVFLREIGPRASQAQVLLFRSGAQLLLVGVSGALLLRSAALVVRTSRLHMHLWRGGLAAVSWWCYFMSFKTLPLALATTLTFSSQLFVILLVWPMLRERVTWAQLSATLVGFVGVLVAAGIWDPSTLDWRVSYGFASAFMGAVMILITRALSFTERTETIMFYMALVVFVSAIPQSLIDWPALDRELALWLSLMGLSGTLGAWLMVEAYRRAEASALAPYTYTRLVFAAALGTWLFGDVIATSTVTGALLIVGSNLALFWYVARTTRPPVQQFRP
jgi:drug/metabolite transporter (DMT)-like permease